MSLQRERSDYWIILKLTALGLFLNYFGMWGPVHMATSQDVLLPWQESAVEFVYWPIDVTCDQSETLRRWRHWYLTKWE